MALINCSNCGREVSDKATICPGCNFKLIDEKKEKNENKESYGGLSIEKMLAYVHVFAKKDLTEFEKAIEVYVDKNGKLQKGKYATVKRVFIKRFKDDYLETIADVNKEVKIDAKAKELKESSNGIVIKMLSEKSENNEENKVVEIPKEQKKVG